ncbi:MAG: hypothetical protein MJ239_03055 [Bacilli bacterium]|nr:hypothetical protein [Bacilli bacterium]
MKISKIIYLLGCSFILAGCNSKNPEPVIKKEPSKITTYLANGEISNLDEYIYDANGKLSQLIESSFYEDGSVIKGRTTFSYSGDYLLYEVVAFYDAETEKWNDNYYAAFLYSPEGNVIENSVYKANNGKFVPQFKQVNDYDENSNRILSTSYIFDSEKDVYAAKIREELTYNESNKLIKDALYTDWNSDSILELSSYETYTYNNDGLVVRNDEYDQSGKLAGYTSYTYETGKTTKVFTLVEGGVEETRTQTVSFYDSESRIEKEEYSFYDKVTSTFALDNYTVYEY